MAARRNLRTALALLAAYVIAVQSLLVATAVPPVEALSHFGQPICSLRGGGDEAPATPSSPLHDCLAACLAAGCGAGYAMPAITEASIAAYAVGTATLVEFQSRSDSARLPVTTGGYHSRAPPIG